MHELIAFYGSLMREHGLLHRLGVAEKLEYLGPCKIPGHLYDLGDYPGLKEAPEGAVAGECFRLCDPTALCALDAYEDFRPADPDASLFVRRTVRLIEPPLECWVYLYAGSVRPQDRVASGHWRSP